MPELPEVHTTERGLQERIKNQTVSNIWTDYFLNTKNKNKNNIKNRPFFIKLKKALIGRTVISTERVGKNILIKFSNEKTLLIHMKMTGHLMYGLYEKRGSFWRAKEDGPLKDPFNRFIHFVINFKNGYSLAFSDMRKFAKITFFESKNTANHPDIKKIGPDPLKISFADFNKHILLQKDKYIKTILMNQSVISGIGNIYSDEILWSSGVNPKRKALNINLDEMKKLFKNTSLILKKSISLGGDSMSDYRNINGEKGGFQNCHMAYRRTGQKCLQKNCSGKIKRGIIGGRSCHFCNKHQK